MALPPVFQRAVALVTRTSGEAQFGVFRTGAAGSVTVERVELKAVGAPRRENARTLKK